MIYSLKLAAEFPEPPTTLYFNKGYLELEVEHVYSKMVDWIKADGHFGKVGISGGSTNYVLEVS